jgi:recombination protein RecA
MNIINKSGTWFNYGDTKFGQGKEKVRDYLMENPKLLEEIDAKVRENMNAVVVPSKPEAEDEE